MSIFLYKFSICEHNIFENANKKIIGGIQMNLTKKTASIFLCVILSISSVLAFTACGKNNSNNNTLDSTSSAQKANVTVRYLNFKPEVADVYQKIAQEYEKETGVKVVVETAANNEYESTLAAKMSTKSAPTLFQINGPKGYSNWKEYCADLSDSELYKHLKDKSLAVTSSDGKVYGIPVSKEISYIYYNKDLFAEAGLEAPDVAYETWDEFFDACDTLKSKNITPVSMDTADLGWLSNLWYSGLIGTSGEEGNEFMNTAYPTDYNVPVVEEATEQLQKMLENYTTSDAAGGKYDTMATHFFNGEVAMLPNGPWMIPDFNSTEKAPEGFYDKVGIMLLPGAGLESVSTPGDMVGASDPKKIEAAVAFLKFETTAENQLKALEMAGLQPVSSNIEVPDSLKESDPLMAEVLEIQSKAKYTYGQNQAYWYQNVIDTFSNQLPELAYGNITATEFCEKLTESAQKN